MTLVEQRLPVPVVVVDNGGYQEIRDQEPPAASRRSASTCAPRTSPPSRVAMGAHGVAHHLDGRPHRPGRRRTRRRRPDPHPLRHPLRRNLCIMDIADRRSSISFGMIAFGFWGKRASHNAIRLPRRRPSPRPVAVLRHDGRHRARRRVHDRRRRAGLPVRHLGHVVGDRHRRGHPAAQSAIRGPDPAAARLHRSQMLELRYGPGSSVLSGVVMWGYTLMLSVTSTIAYSTIFGALFDIGKVPAIILGGSVVIIYSTLGGMWSITLTDFVQFLVKTIGIFFILLPLALYKTGGMSGLAEKLPADATSLTAIGGENDPDLLRHLHLRAADRSGHLAAGVHRAQPGRRPLGRRRFGRVLPAVCGGRRGDRDGGQGPAAGAGVPRRRVRPVRRDAAASGAGRSGARCGARRGDVHVQRRADRHRDGVQPGHRCAAAQARRRGG